MPSITLNFTSMFYVFFAAFLFWATFKSYKELLSFKYHLSNPPLSKPDTPGPLPQKGPQARYHQQLQDMGFRMFGYELADIPYMLVGPAWYYAHEDFADCVVHLAAPRGQNAYVIILTHFEDGACIQTNYPIWTEAYESEAFSCNYASHSLESAMEYHHHKALSWREKHGEFVHIKDPEGFKACDKFYWSQHMPDYIAGYIVSLKSILGLLLVSALGSLLSDLAIMFSPEDISGPIIAMWAFIIIISSMPFIIYLRKKLRPIDAELSRPLGLHTLWPRKSKS